MEQVYSFLAMYENYIEYPLGIAYFVLLYNKFNKTSLVNGMLTFIFANLLIIFYFLIGHYITAVLFCLLAPGDLRKFLKLKNPKLIEDGEDGSQTN